MSAAAAPAPEPAPEAAPEAAPEPAKAKKPAPINPKTYHAHLGLARVYRALEDTKQAQKYYEAVTAVAPEVRPAGVYVVIIPDWHGTERTAVRVVIATVIAGILG